MRWMIVLGLVALLGCSTSTNGTVYGETPTLKTAVPVQQVLSNPDEYNSREILVKGTIQEVCQMKGCWLSLAAEGKTMVVRFKDYAFFVPKDIAGRTVTVQGVFHAENLPHEHEEGESDETCGENEMDFSMVASGVIVDS
ncbi:MAG: DUF4920 domain-containing protein [Candidatus Neomarinimicrobiota bacterium]|nr:MAG: DUF4920 domain-containing protein [Candidatus Neomarinimicrobiota bacterium]